MAVKVEKTMTAFFANKVRKALHKKIKGWTPFNSRAYLIYT